MAYIENAHVKRMYRFLPFRPGISEIVTELQTEAQKLDIKTGSIEFVSKKMKDFPGVIILTGNAGHGKTYICERVLSLYANMEPSAAKSALRDDITKSDGVVVEKEDGNHTIRIHKDLSQDSPSEAVEYLVGAVRSGSPRTTTLICANEGRLRAILEQMHDSAPSEAEKLRESLRESIEKGIASRSLDIVIINLNFQSITANNPRRPQGSMISEALHEWVNDGRSWNTCKNCDAKKECPILGNRSLLVESSNEVSGATGETRQAGLVQLFRTAELFGHVTTIREMLMVLAYVISGGLDCSAVHRQSQKGKVGWNSRYAFHQNVFAVYLKAEQFKSMPLLGLFKRLDPGGFSQRKIDDPFSVGLGIAPLQWDLVMFSTKGNLPIDACTVASGQSVSTTGTETGKEEAADLTQAMQVLRRRAYFDMWNKSDKESDFDNRARRQGLNSLAEMEWFIREGHEGNLQKRLRIKNEIIRGLNALQGLLPDSNNTKLSIVHPGFSKHARRVALLSGGVDPSDVKLAVSPPEWDEGQEAGLVFRTKEVTDWHPSEIWVSIRGESLPLNLRRFDYIRRAGSGFVSRSFYSGDIRRIVNFLTRVAPDEVEQKSSFLIQAGNSRFEISVSENLLQ